MVLCWWLMIWLLDQLFELTVVELHDSCMTDIRVSILDRRRTWPKGEEVAKGSPPYRIQLPHDSLRIRAYITTKTALC